MSGMTRRRRICAPPTSDASDLLLLLATTPLDRCCCCCCCQPRRAKFGRRAHLISLQRSPLAQGSGGPDEEGGGRAVSANLLGTCRRVSVDVRRIARSLFVFPPAPAPARARAGLIRLRRLGRAARRSRLRDDDPHGLPCKDRVPHPLGRRRPTLGTRLAVMMQSMMEPGSVTRGIVAGAQRAPTIR